MSIEIPKNFPYKSEKIKTEYELVKIVQEEKLKSKKIGLCIGGYDLLHPGHMVHLSSAKSLCDLLIIGVAVDELNAKRKGSGRPIYPDFIRMYSLSQLIYVDYIFISNYVTAVEAIKLIRPNLYIKGPDFIKKQTPGIIAEREAIKSVGGKIKYTTDKKLSTTEIIDYIKREVK